MWYSSPSASPQGRVSPNENEMVASIETDLRPTGHVAAAERSSGLDFVPNATASPSAQPGKAAAAAAGPGTEYWLP